MGAYILKFIMKGSHVRTQFRKNQKFTPYLSTLYVINLGEQLKNPDPHLQDFLISQDPVFIADLKKNRSRGITNRPCKTRLGHQQTLIEQELQNFIGLKKN